MIEQFGKIEIEFSNRILSSSENLMLDVFFSSVGVVEHCETFFVEITQVNLVNAFLDIFPIITQYLQLEKLKNG